MLNYLKHLKTCNQPSNFIKRKLSQNNPQKQDSLSYCANIVRQHDYENYLATLLMSKHLRSTALVVRAFNAEVARIQDQTQDSQIAAMRLQFWQDTVNLILKKPQDLSNIPANPVAQELYKVCSCQKLPRRYLERLIISRSNILKKKHFQNVEDIENHSEYAVSSVYYLLLSSAGINNVHADHVASHLGKAQGIVNILRSIHVSNFKKMVSLPMDMLMKNNISQETVLRGIDNEAMRNVVFEVASRANSHLQKARSIEVPKETRQIFLPAIAVDKYLKRLQKNNFNIYDMSLQKGNPTLPFYLYYNRLLNKY